MRYAFDIVLSDCTKFGTKIQTKEYLPKGKYPIIDQGQDEIAGYRNDPEGLFTDVPAIIFGDHTRVVKYIDKPCFLGADGVKLLCPVQKDANCKFLYYQLKNARIPDTGYNRHFKWVKALDFFMPSNGEQESIVVNLDEIATLITLRKQQLSKLNELVKSRFIEMFGDPVCNPMGWTKGTIRDVVTDVKYGTSRPASEGGKYKYLRMGNITYDGHLDLSDLKYIDIPDNEVDKCIVRKGDVLFNRTNSKELVGKTCVFDLDEPMIIAGYIIRVRTNEKVIPLYLSMVLNSQYGKKTLAEMCKAIIGQANINAQELQNISILIPPLPLQNQFADFVQQVDKSKSETKLGLEKLELLKNALMQKYFG